jgi:membrane protease YdiL (CAAX protease family)
MEATPPPSEYTPGPPPDPTPEPARLGRWSLAALLFLTYLPLQALVALPVVMILISNGQLSTLEDLERFITSEPGIWLSILAAAVAALATIALAGAWPRLWRWLSGSQDFGPSEWLAWRRPERIGLWRVGLITLPFLLITTAGVERLAGSTEVSAQLYLFSQPGLMIASTLVVSTVAPLAEEFLFRGALYNALLPRRREGVHPWQRHLVPLVVTSLLFAAVHLLAGFETAPSIILITLFSLYLGTLRAVTGSVQAPVLGHVIWNLAGSLALILTNLTA